MEIHHGKHHAGYTNNLNNAIKDSDLEGKSIEEILSNLNLDNSAVRNNGGGFYNHCLFWDILSPREVENQPALCLMQFQIHLGSFDDFKTLFSKAAATRFGSGWAWLCVHPGGKLEICSTANQDNPLMKGIGCGGTPILALDVWEHAYYLNYQNRRPDYIAGFFNIVDWNSVSALFDQNK